MTPQETLYKAAELKLQIASLEQDYDWLKPEIEKAVQELASDEKPAVTVGELGTFSLGVYRKWQYSPRVLNLEDEVKSLKKTEEADGTATALESTVVKFISKKV